MEERHERILQSISIRTIFSFAPWKNELTNLFCYQVREKKGNWLRFRTIKMLYQIIWNCNPAGKFATRPFLSSLDWCFAVFIFHWHWIVYLFYSSNIHLCKSINTSERFIFSQQWKIPCQWRNWHAQAKKKLYTRNNQKHIFLYIHILSSKSFYHVQVNLLNMYISNLCADRHALFFWLYLSILSCNEFPLVIRFLCASWRLI